MQFFTRGNESFRAFLFLTASNEVFIENYTMASATKMLRHKFYYLPLRLYHIFKTLILVLLLCIIWNKYFVESKIYIISIQVKFIYKITLILTYILMLFCFIQIQIKRISSLMQSFYAYFHLNILYKLCVPLQCISIPLFLCFQYDFLMH